MRVQLQFQPQVEVKVTRIPTSGSEVQVDLNRADHNVSSKFVFRFLNSSIFFAFNPLKRFRLDFFFFCARESILVYFWCLRCFILFSSLSPQMRFRVDFFFFCVEKAFLSMLGVCVLVCVSIWIFHEIFFALNPLKRFRLDFFFFCARESILVYFWCLRCFILFSSLFPPKAISWDFSFFCVGGSFFGGVQPQP